MINFRNVIVTGSNGWLGVNLVQTLVSLSKIKNSAFFGANLICLSEGKEPSPSVSDKSIIKVIGDLQSASTVDQLLEFHEEAVVFNLAGVIHPPLFQQSNFNKINNLATVSFAEKAVEKNIRKFVSMSSNSPCGYSKSPTERFTEKSAFKPYMGYGVSKMRMEMALQRLADEQSNTNFSIIRSPWFYGPYQPERQTEFFRLIRSGLFPLVGKGSSVRSMAYVDNIIQGLLSCAQYFQSNGEVFWVADKNPYTMADIVETVKRVLSADFGLTVSPRQLYLPSVISDIARYADSALQGVGIYAQKVHVLSEMNQTIACSIDKANRLLGYRPEVSLEDGMRASVDWCITSGRKL